MVICLVEMVGLGFVVVLEYIVGDDVDVGGFY